MIYLIDTNFILRLFLDDLPSQTQKVIVQIQKIVEADGIIEVLNSVIAEVICVATSQYYQVSRRIISSKLINFLEQPFMFVEKKKQTLKALKLFGSNKLDFVDCLIISRAQDSQSKILTFDQALVNFVK